MGRETYSGFSGKLNLFVQRYLLGMHIVEFPPLPTLTVFPRDQLLHRGNKGTVVLVAEMPPRSLTVNIRDHNRVRDLKNGRQVFVFMRPTSSVSCKRCADARPPVPNEVDFAGLCHYRPGLGRRPLCVRPTDRASERGAAVREQDEREMPGTTDLGIRSSIHAVDPVGRHLNRHGGEHGAHKVAIEAWPVSPPIHVRVYKDRAVDGGDGGWKEWRVKGRVSGSSGWLRGLIMKGAVEKRPRAKHKFSDEVEV